MWDADDWAMNACPSDMHIIMDMAAYEQAYECVLIGFEQNLHAHRQPKPTVPAKRASVVDLSQNGYGHTHTHTHIYIYIMCAHALAH